MKPRSPSWPRYRNRYRADEGIKELIQFRRDSYAAVFDGIIEEENELSALYEPRALLEAAKTHLLSVWERGSSADVADAMAKFRETAKY
jgi:hypothetical protein